MDWFVLWAVGFHRLGHDCCFLLSTTSTKQSRPYQKRNNQPSRLCWWIAQHWWHAIVHDGLAGVFLGSGSFLKNTDTILVGRLPIRLGLCSCTRTPSHRRSHASHPLPNLGDLRREVPDVSIPPQEGPSDYGLDIGYYLHLGRQLFLSSALLAHTSVQCVWPRPCWSGHPRYPNRILHPCWSLCGTMATLRVSWSEQTSDDHLERHDDSR